MQRLFRETGFEKSIFRNEGVLLPDYLPEELPGREKELELIASFLRPVLKARPAESVLIHGRSGTGKTSCVKFVLRELEESTQNVLVSFMNCWEVSTRHGVLSRLASRLSLGIPSKGWSTESVISRLSEAVSKSGKALIVVLDEVDRLFGGGEESVLYDLLRSKENLGMGASVIGITNNFEACLKLDDRIRSSFLRNQVEFKPYSPIQLKEILDSRAKLAFSPGACPPSVISLAAAHAAKNGGSARIALETLWLAGRNAEKRGGEKILEEDVRNAFHEKSLMREKQAIDSLSENERIVLEIVRRNEGIYSSELYKEFKKIKNETDRSIRNAISGLEEKKLVRSQLIAGNGVRRKIFSCNEF